MDPTQTSPPLTDRIIALIAVLSQAVIDRGRVPGMTAAVIAYVTGKLLGVHLRFRGVIARIAAGTLRADKPRKPRVRKPKPVVDSHLPRGWRKWLPKDTKEKPIWRVLRTDRFAWLCNVIPTIPGFRQSAAICGSHLRQLLDDPEMQALLGASRRVGDSLRPLCWMLGVEVSLLYPAKPAAAEVFGAPPMVGAAAPADDCQGEPAVSASACGEEPAGPVDGKGPEPASIFSMV